MYPLSPEARIALTQSHGMQARATVYSPVAGVLQLPIAAGEVVSDATSQVRRTGTLTADPTYWPRSPGDMLAPFGAEVVPEYGIVLSSGNIEWVPCGRLSLNRVKRSRPRTGDAGMTVELVDRSARVADDRLDAPTQTVSGATCAGEIVRLVQATLGSGFPVTITASTAQVAPVMEIARERWAAVEKLADALAAEVFFDRLGGLVIAAQPTLADPAVWQVRVGEYGTILTAEDDLSRETAYTRVRVSGAGTITATVTDTNPSSPTYHGGPFGKKSRYYSSPLLATQAQADACAAALFARVTGSVVQISYETLVNPALDAGDVITSLDEDGVLRTHILDQVPIPLTPTGTQQLRSRSVDLPPEEPSP